MAEKNALERLLEGGLPSVLDFGSDAEGQADQQNNERVPPADYQTQGITSSVPGGNTMILIGGAVLVVLVVAVVFKK